MPKDAARIIVSGGGKPDIFIAGGIKYTGFRIDDKPIVNTEKMKSWATDPRYVAPGK